VSEEDGDQAQGVDLSASRATPRWIDGIELVPAPPLIVKRLDHLARETLLDDRGGKRADAIGGQGAAEANRFEPELLVALERLKRKAGTPGAVHGPDDKHIVGDEAKRAKQSGSGNLRLQFRVLRAVFDLENPAVRHLAMKLLGSATELLHNEVAGHLIRNREPARRVRRKIELRHRDRRSRPHPRRRQRVVSRPRSGARRG
jgi:hypothetical protein